MRNHGWKSVVGAAAPMMAVVLVAAAVTPVPAQDTISTDRPGLGFSPSLVPTGDIQIELGLPAIERSGGGDSHYRLVNFPTLLRVGATKNLELRLGSPLYNLARDGDNSSNGFGPVELGAKVDIAPSAASPELALIPSVVLPIGDDEFAGDHAGFTLYGVAGWPLPHSLSLSTIGGALVEPGEEEGDADAEYQISGALVGIFGRSLTDRLSGYVEAGWFPTWEAGSPLFLGAFLTFLLTDSLQLDGFFDRGLNTAATDWLFGTGISVRF